MLRRKIAGLAARPSENERGTTFALMEVEMPKFSAEARARELFGKTVESVQLYSRGEWRDGGWKGWRVTLTGNTIHWMSRRGRHEEEVCCTKQHRKRVEPAGATVVVVKR